MLEHETTPGVGVTADELVRQFRQGKLVDPSFPLHYDRHGLQLMVSPDGPEELGQQPLRVDFVSDPRFRQPLRVSEPLARAVGLGKGQRPHVGDLSAGLGRDAWALASAGCRVEARERHPVIAALLADGLARARADAATRAIAERIDLVFGEAAGLLADPPPVLLFDPMFPERQKSALVKRAMRLFRQLVGEDPDAGAVLAAALQSGCRRVVVKRPRHAPELGGITPTHVIHGTRLRFDVYLPTPVQRSSG
ncbi:MAG: class I SAM-dependent methyltransferase [Halothiobacillaceae bacterium]